MLGGILIGVFMFMFLVFIHELGHFLAAKKAGVKVLEFGIGIPPKAVTLGSDKDGTEYTLNRIPLGGFVRLKGEDPNTEDFLEKDSFITASLPRKLIILGAGVFVNFLFARFIFSVVFMVGVRPITLIPDNVVKGENTSLLMPTYSYLQQEGYVSGDVQEIPAVVTNLQEGGLADSVGVQKGDTILSVNDKKITNTTLGLVLKSYMGRTFDLIYEREGEQLSSQVSCPEDQCLLGVAIERGGTQEILPIRFGFGEAIGRGRNEMISQSKLTFSMLGTLGSNLFSFDKERISGSVKNLSGPVGIVKFGDTILKQGGIWMYFAFGGMISLALAIFNILPIPALDGGRALGAVIQSVFRIKPAKYFVIENYFNLFFFVALMLLGIYIIMLDLVRFWGVNIPWISG